MQRACVSLATGVAVAVSIAAIIPAFAKEGSFLRRDVQTSPHRMNVAQAQPAPATPAQPAAPPAPKRTEILNFDSWSVTCSEFTEGPRKRVCFGQLRVLQEKTKKVILVWLVGLDKDNRAMIQMQTVTGVRIEPGVELKLPNAPTRKLPYTTCGSANCMASLPLDPTLVRDLIAAQSAEVVFHLATGQNVQLKFPAKGFEKAYAALRR